MATSMSFAIRPNFQVWGRAKTFTCQMFELPRRRPEAWKLKSDRWGNWAPPSEVAPSTEQSPRGTTQGSESDGSRRHRRQRSHILSPTPLRPLPGPSQTLLEPLRGLARPRSSHPRALPPESAPASSGPCHTPCLWTFVVGATGQSQSTTTGVGFLDPCINPKRGPQMHPRRTTWFTLCSRAGSRSPGPAPHGGPR